MYLYVPPTTPLGFMFLYAPHTRYCKIWILKSSASRSGTNEMSCLFFFKKWAQRTKCLALFHKCKSRFLLHLALFRVILNYHCSGVASLLIAESRRLAYGKQVILFTIFIHRYCYYSHFVHPLPKWVLVLNGSQTCNCRGIVPYCMIFVFVSMYNNIC